MAFGYRKRNPGSGGARPGAGRRPDIPLEIRFEIGLFCEERYSYECRDVNARLWIDQMVEIWLAANHTIDYRNDLYDSLFKNIEPSNAERAFGYYFIYQPLSIYDDNGNLNFGIYDCTPILRIITNQILGYEVLPPTLNELPRNRIAWTKNRIILETQRILSDPNQEAIDLIKSPLFVSPRFIKSCWHLFHEWADSQDMHNWG